MCSTNSNAYSEFYQKYVENIGYAYVTSFTVKNCSSFDRTVYICCLHVKVLVD